MNSKPVTDYDILKRHHQLIPENDGSWESSLVEKYHESLFKEFAICDLSQFKTGQIGIRWRTEAEVIRGKGEKTCASKTCDENYPLFTYQLTFNYTEQNIPKRALVKVRVCDKCAEAGKIKPIEMGKKSLEKFPLEREGILGLAAIIAAIDEFHSTRNTRNTLKHKLHSLVNLQLKYIELLNLQLDKISTFELETVLTAERLLGLEKKYLINKDKFDNIPLAIRRRSTHSDVDELYKKIIEIASNEEDGVTRSRLIEKGLKIVGQTGNLK